MSEVFKTPEAAKSFLDGVYEKVQDVLGKSKSDRQKVDTDKDLVGLSDDEKNAPLEAPKSVWGMNFDLSKYYESDPDKQPKINENAVYFLNGSVDRTHFNKKTKKENIVVRTDKDAAGVETTVKWYEDAKATAAYFLKYADRIDTEGFSTMEVGAKRDKMMEIIKAMSEMDDFTDVGWNKMIKDNSYTDAEIFGPEGAYNLLLAFNRAAGNILLEDDNTVVVGKDANGADIEVPVYYKFKLQLAKKSGNRRKDRFGKIVELKVKEEEKPTPEPVKPEPVKPEPVKPEPVKPEPVKPEPKPEPIKPPKAPEVAEVGLKETVEAMRKAGFEVVIEPKTIGGAGYAKFNNHRLDFSITKGGKVNFQIITLPAGQPGGEKKTGSTVEEMKTAVEAVKEVFDPVKVMYADLDNADYTVKGARADVEIGEELKGKNPNTGLPYPKNTHEVTVKGAKLEVGMPPSVTVEDMPDTTFRVTLNPAKPFEAVLGKQKVPPARDAKDLIKNVLKVKYLEMKKAH